MAKGKVTSKHQQDLYKAYQANKRCETNRKRKLEKRLKDNPNDTCVINALKNIKYRRRTPKAPHWSHTSKAWAGTKKAFAENAVKMDHPKNMFSIKERLRTSWI